MPEGTKARSEACQKQVRRRPEEVPKKANHFFWQRGKSRLSRKSGEARVERREQKVSRPEIDREKACQLTLEL
jgi:hypothetical protein